MKKLIHHAFGCICGFAIVVSLAGCGAGATPEPTQDLQLFATNAAKTVEVRFTETAIAQGVPELPAATYTPVVYATEEPAMIVNIPEAVAVSEAPAPEAEEPLMIKNPGIPAAQPESMPAAPTESVPEMLIQHEDPNQMMVEVPVVPTATLASTGNKATYDSQEPLDGTRVKAGESFDITWYLLNSGSTTWTTDYCLRYFTGTNFTKPGKSRFYLNQEVPPNALGACTLDAVAPDKPGTYQMAVVLGNENDENFFVVDITIVVD